MDLVDYFRDAAYHSLALLSLSTAHIRDLIMSMIFSRDTPSRRALFYALLAFSSLHRSGLHRKTMLFKVAALAALSASAKEASDGLAAAAQHIAACMILCSFEIFLPTENSGDWILYVQGAIEIIQHSRLENKLGYGDNSKLVDWVYYHGSMSRFALFHWRHRYLTMGATSTPTSVVPQMTRYPLWPDKRTASLAKRPACAVLNILSEICDVLLDPSDPKSQEKEYKDRLRALEAKVDSLPTVSSATTALHKPNDELAHTLALYKTAIRVYLARASQNPLEPMADMDSLLDLVYAGSFRHNGCRHFFPLLILSCEARTDEQRASILDLIERTEKNGNVRSMKALRPQVQSFWKQQDLYADGDLVMNYLDVMKAVISSNTSLPSYV
ncbi:hypothetical protein Trco_004714 [Trichoderma cornu-damae]|uniref:Uncharacterized protein n=1 Tax=Trichoderma cornu-damae TaxID=654480 RepID=A0A9P8QGA7_9HYPO|nr:hypothetical protein Trco_004714 [Trichoderma cornu-damae]